MLKTNSIPHQLQQWHAKKKIDLEWRGRKRFEEKKLFLVENILLLQNVKSNQISSNWVLNGRQMGFVLCFQSVIVKCASIS